MLRSFFWFLFLSCFLVGCNESTSPTSSSPAQPNQVSSTSPPPIPSPVPNFILTECSITSNQIYVEDYVEPVLSHGSTQYSLTFDYKIQRDPSGNSTVKCSIAANGTEYDGQPGYGPPYTNDGMDGDCTVYYNVYDGSGGAGQTAWDFYSTNPYTYSLPDTNRSWAEIYSDTNSNEPALILLPASDWLGYIGLGLPQGSCTMTPESVATTL